MLQSIGLQRVRHDWVTEQEQSRTSQFGINSSSQESWTKWRRARSSNSECVLWHGDVSATSLINSVAYLQEYWTLHDMHHTSVSPFVWVDFMVSEECDPSVRPRVTLPRSILTAVETWTNLGLTFFTGNKQILNFTYVPTYFTYVTPPLLAQMINNQPAMQETRVWSLGQEDLLEKGMATHFSILAWRIPWMEESGKLQSMGSQRVTHNWVMITFAFLFTHLIGPL